MKRRSLSKDETALWKRATRGVRHFDRATPAPGPPGLKTGETTREAMFPTKADVERAPSVRFADTSPARGGGITPGPPQGIPPPLAGEVSPKATEGTFSRANRSKGGAPPWVGGALSRKAKSHPSSAFAAGDPALDRRARRGRIAVDRTIDLHGMTQIAARVALTAFLEKAHKDQCRCVLVVTGKGAGALERSQGGAASTGKAGLGDYAVSGSSGERRPRGIIRRRFQEWLDEEPLRALVARAAPAAPKDGGAGAFYVFLKRKKARL